MPEDRSLDEFVGADSTADADEGATDDNEPPEGGAGEASDDGEPPEGDDGAAGDGERTVDDDSGSIRDDRPDDSTEAITPARSTATWTSGGAACTRCGTVVERRWVDDEALVCGSCMDW